MLKCCLIYNGSRSFPPVLQSVSLSSRRLQAEEIGLVIRPLMTAGLIDFRSAEMRRNNVRIHPQRQSESNESRKQPTARIFAAETQNRPRRDKSSRSDPTTLDELKGTCTEAGVRTTSKRSNQPRQTSWIRKKKQAGLMELKQNSVPDQNVKSK